MKKIVFLLLAAPLFAACGKSKTGKQYAEEVCDCSKKANALPVSDPNRSKAQDDCLKQQQEAWKKIEADRDKATEFNDALGKCASEQIKKSFGQ